MKKILFLTLAAASFLAAGCVKVDNSLGKGLVDDSLLFDIYTVEFPLEEVYMRLSGDLSAYSDSHLTIGAIRDEDYGLTTRTASFSLIPVLDTIDLGDHPVAQSFDLYFEADTVSVAEPGQEHILQNIYVTELLEKMPTDESRLNKHLAHGNTLITNGLPVYNGSNALHFAFSKEYAQKVTDAIKQLGPVLKSREEGGIDKYDDYVSLIPGIHLETDAPVGNGGRINLFDFSCLSVVSNYYQRNDNVGLLKINSTWNGVQKDSTFMFIPGETAFEDESSYLELNTKFDQYCYNDATHETEESLAGSILFVEGGGGLKPVISALELQEKTLAAILSMGGDPLKTSIVKASIVLPFDMPEDYTRLDLFPTMLSPTIRTTIMDSEGTEHLTFAGLTDASVSTEDQGDIDRSNLEYSPDITYHLQEILTRDDLDTATNADIWLLTIHTEKVANASGSYADNQYLQNLMYASYYNSLYGGGYGYGGYGSGYNSYSNYYSYMMLAQMMSAQSQQTYSYTTELDCNRFYKAVMCGPESNSNHPLFRVTFAVPKE